MSEPIRIALVSDAGSPFADLEVELIDTKGRAVNAKTRCFDVADSDFAPWAERFALPVMLKREVSGDRGMVVFAMTDPAGDLVLRVSGSGVVTLVQHLDLLGGDEEGGPLKFVLPSPGSMTFILENRPADLPPVALLLARSEQRTGRREVRRIPLPAEGSLVIQGLTPGTWHWQLERIHAGANRRGRDHSAMVEVAIDAGSNQEVVVDGTRWSPASLHLEMVVGQKPMSAWVAIRRQATGRQVVDRSPLDSDGRYVAEGLLPGGYALGIQVAAGTKADSPRWSRDMPVVLQAGRRHEELLHFPKRRLRVQLTLAGGGPVVDCPVSLRGDSWFVVTTTDAYGVIDLALVPCEEVSVTMHENECGLATKFLGRAHFAAGQEYLAVDYRVEQARNLDSGLETRRLLEALNR